MKKKSGKIYPIVIFIATLFMAIGYAAVNSVLLNIDGMAKAELQEGIYITDVNYDSNVGTDYTQSEIIYAYQTMLNSNIVLSSTNRFSSITYEITIYNSNNEDYAYIGEEHLVSEDTYSNQDITFKLNGLNVGDIIKGKDTITFTITFYYKDNVLSSKNTLKSLLNFKFEKVYYVTYENFSSTNGYPTYAIAGGTLSVSFGTLDAPIEVKKNNVLLSSNNYSYSNYKLTLNNVDGEIHIRKLTPYTITNLVVNGSFENGFHAWGVVGNSSKLGTASPSVNGNYFAYRMASSEGSNFLIQNIVWVKGHVYYYFGYAATASSSGQEFRCNVTNWDASTKFSIRVYGTYLRGSSRFTMNFDSESSTIVNSISVNYANITDNVNVDAIGVIDLTAAFGAGNEPTKEWCDNNINYFDGSTIVYK